MITSHEKVLNEQSEDIQALLIRTSEHIHAPPIMESLGAPAAFCAPSQTPAAVRLLKHARLRGFVNKLDHYVFSAYGRSIREALNTNL